MKEPWIGVKYGVLLGILFCCLVGMLTFAGCTEAGEAACEMMEGRDRDHCLQQVAATTGDLSICQNITAAGPKSKCYIFVAEKEKSALVCSAMEKTDWYRDIEAYDKYDCFMYLARQLKDPGLCSDIPEQYYGYPTDVNPGIPITQSNCYNSIPCGTSGLPACYSSLDHHYSCTGADGQKVIYDQPATCA
jgi:hypothetical protein